MLIVGAETLERLSPASFDKLDGPLLYLYAADPDLAAEIVVSRSSNTHGYNWCPFPKVLQ
jgi:hypothetical protein